MFEWLFNKNSPKRIAKKAVRRAKKLLRSRQAPAMDVKVDYLLWYGAVEIDPKYCVVWIIVRGSDSARIPDRLMPARDEKSIHRARESPERGRLPLVGRTRRMVWPGTLPNRR